jgi:hypothetical protein
LGLIKKGLDNGALIEGCPPDALLSFEGKQEDKESGKQANFYFRGLTPFPL